MILATDGKKITAVRETSHIKRCALQPGSRSHFSTNSPLDRFRKDMKYKGKMMGRSVIQACINSAPGPPHLNTFARNASLVFTSTLELSSRRWFILSQTLVTPLAGLAVL